MAAVEERQTRMVGAVRTPPAPRPGAITVDSPSKKAAGPRERCLPTASPPRTLPPSQRAPLILRRLPLVGFAAEDLLFFRMEIR